MGKRLFLKLSILSFTLLSACSTPGTSHPKLSGKEKAVMLVDVASSSINEGDSTGALITLREANELDPKLAEVHYLFALAYYQKSEPALAIASARKAIELKPDFSKAKNTLGKLLMDEGKFSEAEKYLTEAAHDLTSRDSYLPKTNLGILYYKRMNVPQAMFWFTSALKESSSMACLAAYYRGKIYLEQSEFEKAKADFTTATKNACSTMAESHLAMGQTLIRLKKYDQARAKMLEIKQLFPTSESANAADRYLREIP